MKNTVIGNGVIAANTAQVDGVMGQSITLENIVIGNGANLTFNGGDVFAVQTINLQKGSTVTVTEHDSITTILGGHGGESLTHFTVVMIGDDLITPLDGGDLV